MPRHSVNLRLTANKGSARQLNFADVHMLKSAYFKRQHPELNYHFNINVDQSTNVYFFVYHRRLYHTLNLYMKKVNKVTCILWIT